MKEAWYKSSESIKENHRENKEIQQSLEGSIIRYEVIYIGGLPKDPKAKHGHAIGMNIMTDKFCFTIKC